LTWIRDLDLAGGPFWSWTALTAGLGTAALLTVLARGERDLVSRKVWGFLWSLRLLAAGLLALLLAEPVVGRVVREPAKGRVIVAVDVSNSMATVDPDRPPTEAARLKAALNADVSSTSRREIVRRFLERPQSPLTKLDEEHDLEYFAFAESTTPTAKSGLLEQLAAKLHSASGNATDWRPVLAEAARKGSSDEPPRVAVVLIGDGRFHPSNLAGTQMLGADETPEKLARMKIPVFSLLVGSEAAPRDLAVAGLLVPETAFLDDTAPVEAKLVVNGFRGRDVAVTLTANPPGKAPYTSIQTIRPATDLASPIVRFQLPLTVPGVVPLRVAIAAVAPEPEPQRAEARLDNNQAEQSIEVIGDPARVLLIDGEPRWEFRYLRNALARDPHVRVEAVVPHQPALVLPSDRAGGTDPSAKISKVPDLPTYPMNLPALGDPEKDDPLSRFDAIILGDVAPADIPVGFWERLESHVAERGGTLIIVPGPRHWRELWGEAAARSSIPRALTPLTGLRAATIDESLIDPDRPSLPPGIPVVPTPEALAEQSAWPMFRIRETSTLEDVSKLWADLPRQPWALIGRLKPGATALAAALGSGGETVIASQRFGLGRVLWMGIDGTWRWRYRVGDALHHRFWGQTVRWASASGKLTGGDDRVRFGATRTRVEEGDPVRIRARISETPTNLPAQPILAARVASLDDRTGAGSETLIALRPLAGQPQTFEGKTPPLAPGRYSIRVEAPTLGEYRGTKASFQVVPRFSGEKVELAASRTQLERLAQATGGQVVDDDEAERLVDLLRPFARSTTVPRFRVISLWDQPATILVFLAIVSADWVVRKRVGLR